LDTEAAQNETVAVRVEIRTSGGFTGRGIGNVTIEDASPLGTLIDAALLAPEPANVKSTPDAVHYQMTVARGSHQHTFIWTDDAEPPAAVLALFNAAWAMRQ
jgi:hypothetical protein